ncbi:hydrophobe/amphiphile efflux-1 (HAE1) family protein [Bradyrhizobium sp. USDA 4452]
MPGFFIDRPIFAWVVALFICLVGAISIPLLAVAQYPIIAPPSISISTSYPGASPENLYNSVTRLIEEELNGAANILNFESTSDSLGQVEIIANFKPGTDTSQASVEVQNRLKRVEARLPRAVIQQGILVEEASSAVLQIITLNSTDGSLDEVGLGDFMIRNVLGEVRRIPGVGRATLYSTERSLRIWIDPAKLVGYGLSADDVNKAITAQNAQVASGSIGAEPSTDTQTISAQVLVKGQLSSPDEFGAIILRANADGSTVRLRDVARIEIGGLSYQFNTRLDGKPTAGLSVLLSPKGNALATASAVEAKMKELSRFFPANISYEIPYNITPVVKASIEKVLMTLVEAVVLVFIVMFLFLQNIRYTIIPTIVVPVALLGACATLMVAGFSINMLTMFGMVLAVGILVDDAIVVVENVERIMAEEGLPPKEATKKAMSQISGAIIGITLVLMAVFVPMAFFPGSVGIIYRQFSVTMVAAIAFSALLALSLTPALCATLLKPVEKGHGHARKGVFGAFNRVLDSSRAGYVRTVQGGLKRTGRLMLIYLVLFAGVAYGFVRLPGGFLPVDDQGFITTDVQTPSESSYARTEAAVEQVEKYLKDRAGIENVTFLTGFSFLGQGMNTAQAFITLKDWSERGAKDSAAAIVADINRDLSSSIRDARISALQPPPIDNLGNSSGLLVPPAGPRPERLCGADRSKRPPHRGGQCQPGAAEGLCRRPAAGAAGQSDDRSREGRRVRPHLRGHQQHDLDQSRLELHQRLPEPRAHAARHRAGRQDQPHERGRHPELQRQEQPRPAGAVLGVRHHRMVEGAHSNCRLQLLSGGAHLRRGEAGLHLGRRDRGDGAARRQAAARFRL